MSLCYPSVLDLPVNNPAVKSRPPYNVQLLSRLPHRPCRMVHQYRRKCNRRLHPVVRLYASSCTPYHAHDLHPYLSTGRQDPSGHFYPSFIRRKHSGPRRRTPATTRSPSTSSTRGYCSYPRFDVAYQATSPATNRRRYEPPGDYEQLPHSSNWVLDDHAQQHVPTLLYANEQRSERTTNAEH